MTLSDRFSALRKLRGRGRAKEYAAWQEKAAQAAQERRKAWKGGCKYVASLTTPGILIMKHDENIEMVQELLDKHGTGILVTTPAKVRKMNITAELERLRVMKYGD